ncbi:MAG TPA: hypothetical protein VGK97_07385 [Spongiibacteraceae bacterium]
MHMPQHIHVPIPDKWGQFGVQPLQAPAKIAEIILEKKIFP